MRAFFINTFIILILILLVIKLNWRARDAIYAIQYDLFNENERVIDEQQIEAIVNALETINYDDLDQAYLDYTKSDQQKYKNLVKKLTYYKIKRSDLNKKIAGNFRLKEFICKDLYYEECIMKDRDDIICIFNKKIFFKTLELQKELEKLGHDKDAFRIVNGHRHPAYNENIGGAKLSRHIKGEAVDIVVEDVDQNGYINKKDKDIILDLLENKIIKDKGGIGLYPGSGNVHYDVRGTKARWNSY